MDFMDSIPVKPEITPNILKAMKDAEELGASDRRTGRNYNRYSWDDDSVRADAWQRGWTNEGAAA